MTSRRTLLLLLPFASTASLTLGEAAAQTAAKPAGIRHSDRPWGGIDRQRMGTEVARGCGPARNGSGGRQIVFRSLELDLFSTTTGSSPCEAT